jgi:hypothetical protein
MYKNLEVGGRKEGAGGYNKGGSAQEQVVTSGRLPAVGHYLFVHAHFLIF